VILLQALQGDSRVIEDRNEDFVRREIKACEPFFDTVENTPLTEEQRRACVVMEDRNLLVASAGSGKTSTVVGKVGYLLLRKISMPEEILIVVFNTHAAREIETRIRKRLKSLLPSPFSLKVKTFHALGLEIISNVEGARPTVADLSTGGEDSDHSLIGELVVTLLKTDPSFSRAYVQFHILCPEEAKDPALFQTSRDWLTYLKDLGAYESGRFGFRTLNGEWVKSQGERAIANWLFINGVDYVYERPCVYQTANQQERSFCPDFFLPEIDVYVQHIATDADGHPAVPFAEKVRESVGWKRVLKEKGGTVIETHFSEYVSGDLFFRLEQELTNKGLVLNPLPAEQILMRVQVAQPRQQMEILGLLQTFIKHAKSNRVTPEALKNAALTQSHRARALLFVDITTRIMDCYAAKLQSMGAIDFEDMILLSAQYAHEARYRHAFRHILVDEFQDISQGRANLLLGLLKHAPDCKLFAVGDDWQSIYRFAGSDISLFTGFSTHFGKTATNFLTKTFRSNRGIAEVAAHFVQQNKAQMQKAVVAEDQTIKATLAVRRCKRRGDVGRHIEACLEDIIQETNGTGSKPSVYVLGRYRHLRPEQMEDWETHYHNVLQLEYKTIHSSKGLQADYVILIGLVAGKSGFPSEIADDVLLHLVMPTPETFPHAEERRLFYVALTRARCRVYLISGQWAPSCFLNELVHQNPHVAPMLRFDNDPDEETKTKPIPCPRCGIGTMKRKTGKFGPFYGCSEFPTCRYTQDIDATVNNEQ
jgi:DNA helicase-4